MYINKRKGALLLAFMIFSTSVLTGCSKPETPRPTPAPSAAPETVYVSNPEKEIVKPTAQANTENTVAAADKPTSSPEPSAEAVAVPETDLALDKTQLNSINMLNYLVVLTQEINASKNSRLYLEGAYSKLLNNTSPEAVDFRTQSEIGYLLDTIENFRMINVKRDRLKFILEQNQAQAMRSAIPNPLGLLSATRSFNLVSLISSVAYMAVDSVTSYAAGKEQANLQFIQDGWELDDEEAKNLHEMRKSTFNYMIDTVRDYDLPGYLALSEQAVNDFVEWKNKSNTYQVIQFLEENENVYRGFGPYWLTLAERYYENKDFDKCLKAVSIYENLDTAIFRQDYSYAHILPLAIVAARETMENEEYISAASRYAEALLLNTGNTDWALRYFAAQTFIELYSLSNDKAYLEKAYTITLNNVNHLVDDQRALNEKYMAPVVNTTPAPDATNAQKEEINQYNKMLQAERKTALPPVHEPLLLNCELLFALAQELNVSPSEMKKIDGILHENGQPLFLTAPLDEMFRPNAIASSSIKEGEDTIIYEWKKLFVSAKYVSEDVDVKLTILRDGEEFVFDDWTVEQVVRKEADDISSFQVYFYSQAIQKFNKRPGDILHIEFIPAKGHTKEVLTIDFETVNHKSWGFDNFVCEKVDK